MRKKSTQKAKEQEELEEGMAQMEKVEYNLSLFIFTLHCSELGTLEQRTIDKSC